MIVKDERCYFCHNTQNLHTHHIFEGTANRKKSEQHGMTVRLCAYHHNLGNKCVHNNKEMALILKKEGQAYFEKHIGDREMFIKEFGKNYL